MELDLPKTDIQNDLVSGLLLHPSKVNPGPDFRRALSSEYATACALRGIDAVPLFTVPPLPPLPPLPPVPSLFSYSGGPSCPMPY